MNDYWIVTEKKTGKVISHCGEEKDAQLMVGFNPENRTYRYNKVLFDQVIDVFSTTDKQLPGQQGLPAGNRYQINPERIRLPEGQGESLWM